MTSTRASAPALHLTGLQKAYPGGAAPAVDGVDLTVPPGSFLVLLGPSGCGKSTTLRMLAGLETPTGGEIRFGDTVVAGESGVMVPPGRRDAGLVFQSYALWPHMTVEANIAWPLKVARWSAQRRRERVAEVAELLSIGELVDRYPGEISGGQQQRVAIARMIAPGPGVLLFDEPLSNLDAKLRVETRAELLRVHRLSGATSVYVTHDQVEAMTMATHVALMREGRVEQFGTPEDLVDRPATSFVATFMGTPPANVVPATVVAGRYLVAGVDVGAAAPGSDHDEVSLMYRPASLGLTDAAGHGGLVLEYAESSPLAGRYVVSGASAVGRLSVVTDTRCTAALGDRLGVLLPDRPDAVFGPDGVRLPATPEAVAA